MSPSWQSLLAVVAMTVALLCASANLDEHQGQFQPKEVLRELQEAQDSLMAGLEEYRNSTRGGSVEEQTMESISDSEGMPTRAQASGRYGSGGPSTRERPAKPKYPELMDGQRSVRLNIRVDLVLVGFQGDGGELLDIPQQTLELWLEHLTSVVPHATVADHTPAAASQTGGGQARGGDSSRSSPHAAPEVEYVYRYHVVNVGKRVRDAVEAHMRAYLRDEEEEDGEKRESTGGREGERPTDATGSKQTSGTQMYMPSWHMEELLGSLAVKLQASGQRETRYLPEAAMKTSAAFTLFILNPRPAWVLPPQREKSMGGKVIYGYRCGHSSDVLATLARDEEVVQRAEQVERLEQNRWRIVHGAGGQDNGGVFEDWTSPERAGRYNFGQKYLRHIEWTDGEKASSEWALDRLNEPLSDADSNEKAFLLSRDPNVLPEGNVRALLRDVLEEHRRMIDASGKDSVGSKNRDITRGEGAGACLTDTWVSGERFAWVDLQAGPFAWGPAAGGDGYKSAFSGLAPAPKPLVDPPSKLNGWEERTTKWAEERRRALIAARGKLSARMDSLLALREQMACDEKAESEKLPRKGRRARRQHGAVAVACEEVLAQLTFVQQFQAREGNALSTADAAEAAEAARVAQHGGSTNETFVRNMESLRSHHVLILESALGVLAPATESDRQNRRPFMGSTTALSVDSQVLLARLAALVSSLSRGIITPASTLPLPLPPPDTHSNATGTTRGCGSEGTTAGWPGGRSSSSDHGSSSDCPVPYRLPSGPALTQPRSSGVRTTVASAMVNAAQPSRPSALDVFIPESLEFALYVVSVQDVYPPLGGSTRLSEGGSVGNAKVRAKEGVRAGGTGKGGDDGERTGEGRGGGRYRGSSGFDLPAFQAGAMSLKLPNQKASFTVHQVDSSSGFVLVAALAGATRESSVNGVTAEGEMFTDKRVSIDSARLHHQLKARADEASESGGGGAEEEARRHTRHITILLYSFAGAQSVYVDEMWRARGAGGDTVVVAQSEARRDPAPPLSCGGRAVEDDPRNPLRQALAALGSIVGGLVPSQDSWDETRGGHVVHDWRWSMSESPMSPLVPRARFSEIDQDIIYRTHVVRALSASVQLTRAASSLLLDALRWEDSRKALEGPLRERLTTARMHLKHVSQLRTSIEKDVGTVMAYDYVARQLNPLLDASREGYYLASELARDARDRASGLGRQEGSAGAIPSGGSQQDAGLLRSLLALAVAVLAAWLVRGTAPPFPGARGRKRVKVN